MSGADGAGPGGDGPNREAGHSVSARPVRAAIKYHEEQAPHLIGCCRICSETSMIAASAGLTRLGPFLAWKDPLAFRMAWASVRLSANAR